MVSPIETGIGITIITAPMTLERAVAEYVKKPDDPQRYWDYQKAHWQFNGHVMGLAKSDVLVSAVPWTEDQMRKFMGRGLRGLLLGKHDIPFYLPEVVSGKDGLPLLGKVYPWMGWSEEYLAEVQNVDIESKEVRLSGHLRTEAADYAPYTKTDENQVIEIVTGLGRRGHTLNTYGEGGNQIKLLTGKYPDEISTWVRILNSRAHGRVIHAYFDPDGFCYVYWRLRPGHAYDFLGVRSVGV